VSRARDIADLGNEASGGLTSSDISDLNDNITPHIIPGVLYPAYVASGISPKLLDGATTHGTGTYNGTAVSTDYGTVQADGRKYYYTNIAGSKPIKDPRIGGHFGSQRHKFKSLQLLEQETATLGKEVKCADGREWVRFVDGNWSWHVSYDGNGNYIAAYTDCTNNWFEVTGYFNDINFIIVTDPNRANEIDVTVNGTLSVDGSTTLGGVTSVANPLHSRFVDAGSMINGGSTLSSSLGTTPKINTIKFEIKSGSSKYFYIQAIELIAQDTSNRNNIQIPSQNVVSYGKKFTVSGTPHYDPFNGFTSGSSVSAYIDTATSLGVEKWKHSSTYYRPYNGGRVVKWVDSSGVIKTSVTLMSPNAKSIADSSSLTNGTAKANASASNDTFYPTFEAHTTDVNEDNLHEVAKTFHWREFGNGASNQGTSGTYADASMLGGGTDDIAYVMDDGLTSLSGKDVEIKEASGRTTAIGMATADGGDYIYITFIGTGITLDTEPYGTAGNRATIAQNLPYGSHVLKIVREGANSGHDPDYTIDGVAINDVNLDSYGAFSEVTFYQPKRPPIPEDAVIVSDYCLMADYVQRTADDGATISKGVRGLSATRDLFFDSSGAFGSLTVDLSYPPFGFASQYTSSNQSSGNTKAKIPAFGTQFEIINYSDRADLFLNDSATNHTPRGSSAHSYTTQDSATTLGLNTFEARNNATNNFSVSAFYIATPIHTSHHYQSFESQHLHELIGGDRNMEQTNLVCSPDGKTWDEITRDTSYIGNVVCKMATDTATDWSTSVIFDEWRGSDGGRDWFNKYFAIAYDRMICLVDGVYKFTAQTYSNGSNSYMQWSRSGNGGHTAYATNATYFVCIETFHCKKGDYIQLKGEYGNDVLAYNNAFVEKLR